MKAATRAHHHAAGHRPVGSIGTEVRV